MNDILVTYGSGTVAPDTATNRNDRFGWSRSWWIDAPHILRETSTHSGSQITPEWLEDELDVAASDAAFKEAQEKGTIPFEEIKRKYGLR